MKIKFQPFTATKIPLLDPISAITSLPEWYKNMTPYIGSKKAKFYADRTHNITVKRCNPVGDALSAGYFILLENSISVSISKNGESEMVWNNGGADFVSMHSKDQIHPDLIPDEFSDQPFKFLNSWSIQTPKNYSVLITHPLNRNNMPFLTLSGVIDTDTFHQNINFPFLIKKNFEGIIEAGTPIAQVIPFKREAWKAQFLKHSQDFVNMVRVDFSRYFERYYKRFHWKRKEYK